MKRNIIKSICLIVLIAVSAITLAACNKNKAADDFVNFKTALNSGADAYSVKTQTVYSSDGVTLNAATDIKVGKDADGGYIVSYVLTKEHLAEINENTQNQIETVTEKKYYKNSQLGTYDGDTLVWNDCDKFEGSSFIDFTLKEDDLSGISYSDDKLTMTADVKNESLNGFFGKTVDYKNMKITISLNTNSTLASVKTTYYNSVDAKFETTVTYGYDLQEVIIPD